jgi:hypothetical protein
MLASCDKNMFLASSSMISMYDMVHTRTFQSLMVLSLVDKMCLAPLLLLTHLTCTAAK